MPQNPPPFNDAPRAIDGESCDIAVTRRAGASPQAARSHHSGASFIVETCAAITFQPTSGKRTHVWL